MIDAALDVLVYHSTALLVGACLAIATSLAGIGWLLTHNERNTR